MLTVLFGPTDIEHGPWIALAVFAASGGLALIWRTQARKRRLLDDVPTSKVKGVSVGLVELKGEARREVPLTSWLAGVDCVWYRWSVEERWERTVTEHYTDSEGKRRTRKRKESGWKTVASGEERQPFDIRDDTATIRLDPTAGKIEGVGVMHESVGRSHPLYYGKGPRRSISNSTHQRSFTETALLQDARVYVMGTCRIRSDQPEPEIGFDRDDGWLLVTVRSEQAVANGFGLGANVALGLGGLLAAGSAVPLAPASLNPQPKPWVSEFAGQHADSVAFFMAMAPAMSLTFGAFLLLVAGFYGTLLYNGLVRVLIRMHRAFSLIDVELMRRRALIPRLATVIQAYADYEQDTQESSAGQRARAMTGRGQRRPVKAKDVQAAANETNAQTDTFGRIMAVVEAYPDLKADELFMDLQRQLVDTEDRIALARRFFNESVTVYNDRIDLWPDLIFARLFAFRRSSWFEIKPFERHATAIAMDDGSPATEV